MIANKLLKEMAEEVGYDKAKILMQYVLKTDRNHLISSLSSDLNIKQEKEYRQLVKKAKAGVPVQYLTNNANFFGLNFFVNNNVLIPQPDTEILVEETLKQIENKNKINVKNKIKILDLCTGSGAIALSIAKNAQNVEIYASDISKKALKVAKKNYEELIKNSSKTVTNFTNKKIIEKKDKSIENDIDEKINKLNENSVIFIESDMFKNINDKFDIIVSNPPYIKEDVIDTLDEEVKNEPKIALNGGKDGLKFYKIIKENADKYLKQDGVLLMEIGFDQRKEVEEIFENSICIKDFAGNDRVIITHYPVH